MRKKPAVGCWGRRNILRPNVASAGALRKVNLSFSQRVEEDHCGWSVVQEPGGKGGQRERQGPDVKALAAQDPGVWISFRGQWEAVGEFETRY